MRCCCSCRRRFGARAARRRSGPDAAPALAAPRRTAQVRSAPGAIKVENTFQGNFFNVSTTPLAAGGAAGAFSADLSALVEQGTVVSVSQLGTETLTTVGLNATNATAVTAAVEVGARRGPACFRAGLFSCVPPPCLLACLLTCPPSPTRCRRVQGATLTLSLTVDWLMVSVYTNPALVALGPGVSHYVFRGQLVAQASLLFCVWFSAGKTACLAWGCLPVALCWPASPCSLPPRLRLCTDFCRPPCPAAIL